MQPCGKWQDRGGASSFPPSNCGWCFSSTRTALVLCHKHSYGAAFMYTHPACALSDWSLQHLRSLLPYEVSVHGAFTKLTILICTLHLSLAAMPQDLMSVCEWLRKDGIAILTIAARAAVWDAVELRPDRRRGAGQRDECPAERGRQDLDVPHAHRRRVRDTIRS